MIRTRAAADDKRSVRLSLCMIVRDNETTLPASLESIRPWVDEMIVVDTGSTDDTPRIAERLGARVFHFPWCDDFARARNESLARARGSWLFWMDSDDTIDAENGRKLRELADSDHPPQTLGFVMQVRCPSAAGDSDCTVVDHVKVFRSHPQLRFEFRIHEQIIPSIRRLGGDVQWTDVFVVHSGADHTAEGRKRKLERDLRILQRERQERPDHPFVLFNLGMTYADCDEHAVAIDFLDRCLAVSAPNESHVRKAYALLAHSLDQRGDTDRALEVCADGLAKYPRDPELQFRSGLLFHKEGRTEESIAAYQAALDDAGERHFGSIDSGISSFKARHNLAVVYSDAGRDDFAEAQWRWAVDETPRFVPAWRALGASLLKQRKLVAAKILAEEMLRDRALRAAGLVLEGQLAETNGAFDVARSYFDSAAAEFPDDVDVLEARCRFLFERATLEEARTAIEQLVERRPEDAASLHNLGIVHRQMERPDLAAKVLRESLRLRPDSVATQVCLREVEAMIESGTRPAEPDSSFVGLEQGLPYCHSRHVYDADQRVYFCSHPKVHTPSNLVKAEICRMCTKWEEPVPPGRSPFPKKAGVARNGSCRHLGSEIGRRECPSCRGAVLVKVFACGHPDHESTTVKECLRCAEYEPRSRAEPLPGADTAHVPGQTVIEAGG